MQRYELAFWKYLVKKTEKRQAGQLDGVSVNKVKV